MTQKGYPCRVRTNWCFPGKWKGAARLAGEAGAPPIFIAKMRPYRNIRCSAP